MSPLVGGFPNGVTIIPSRGNLDFLPVFPVLRRQQNKASNITAATAATVPTAMATIFPTSLDGDGVEVGVEIEVDPPAEVWDPVAEEEAEEDSA